MTKVKKILILLSIAIALVLIPNIANAAVSVKKDDNTTAGTQKFYFSGLTLDTKHEYQFGLTKTTGATINDWFLITDYTESTVNIELEGNNVKFTDVITAVEKGYITIKDKTTDSIILDHFQVDLSIPFLKVTNYTVINNGKNIGDEKIEVRFWNGGNSKPFYQYEKIADETLINKYKEIKNKNGDYLELQSLLKKKAPTANWKSWQHWGYAFSGNTTATGSGYTESIVKVPDEGLYYMWLYFQGGANTRNLYGCILVDNLQPDIAVESISLPGTEKVELGKTLKLTPTFNPEKATNKIVTWSSSDESVATVDNNGTVTPKKIGSTVITVVSKDGNKKATCTVTVIASSNSNNSSNNNNSNSNNNSNNSNNNNKNNNTNNNTVDKAGNNSDNKTTTDGKEDKTTAKGTIPQTGVGIGLTVMIVVLVGVTIIAYIKYKKLKEIK